MVKKKRKLGDRDLYDMEGEAEWFRKDELERDGLYQVILYAMNANHNLRCRKSLDPDGHKWFQLTECMMAFFLFTYLDGITDKKVCARELTSFLKLMRCGDIINVYTS